MNITDLFGEGKDLNMLQMCDRGIVVFLISLVLIRISGRRSFGIRTPLDNIIVIMLGAVLSRAVVGASAFMPVIACCFVIVLLHRLLAWGTIKSRWVGHIVEGEKILLFENGRFIDQHMKKALVCQEDVVQGIRKSALTDDLAKIDRVYMERNGEISALKKAGA